MTLLGFLLISNAFYLVRGTTASQSRPSSVAKCNSNEADAAWTLGPPAWTRKTAKMESSGWRDAFGTSTGRGQFVA